MAPVLSGHALHGEGAAYRVGPYGPYRVRAAGTGGFGLAFCACGALSEELPSGTKRKAWHRQHKQDIRTARSITENGATA